MTCSRCLGLMVKDHFFDIKGAYGQMWTASWRCVNCGHIYDPVIEQHRLAREEKVLVPSRGESDSQDDDVHLGAKSLIRQPA